MTEKKVYFDIEIPKCEITGDPADHIFIMRGYENKGDSRYFGVSTVFKRDGDLWEPTAWQTSGKAPKGYEFQGIEFLLGQGFRVSGTFETRRLKAYKRMFRNNFELKTIKIFEKEYNGTNIEFAYVEFITKE